MQYEYDSWNRIQKMTYPDGEEVHYDYNLGRCYPNHLNLVDTVRMAYHKNGCIARKNVFALTMSPTQMGVTNYNRRYDYSGQRNTLANVYDSVTNTSQNFSWDNSGNMVAHNGRSHSWTEDNRLLTVTDNEWFSYYQYDAGGDRTYKLPYLKTNSNRSGRRSVYWAPEHSTLYASPYLVVTPQGYTKHYYAENERIASKLGNGGLSEIDQPLADGTQVYDKFNSNTYHAQNVIYECLNAEEVRAFPPLSYLYELTSASQSPENERYFYHPDHLGSSSWITFTDGEAVQHLHYLPYGEDLVNQQHTAVGAMYTFSAKEKDAETGYSYFGSRYYNSDLSIWLSVDPMADKYPSMSSYVYCADNPVKLVDPNGEEIVLFVNKTKYTYNGKDFVDGNGNVATFSKNSFEYRVLSDLNKLNNSKCNMIRGKLQDMMKSKHQHSIVNRTTSDGVGFNRPIDENLAEEYGKGTDTETGYNPFATKSVCADGGYVSCATLAHELLGHGWNNDQGLHESDNHRTENGIKFEEINAINVQNKVLVEYHQMPRSLVGKPGEAKQIPVNLLNHYYTTKPK